MIVAVNDLSGVGHTRRLVTHQCVTVNRERTTAVYSSMNNCVCECQEPRIVHPPPRRPRSRLPRCVCADERRDVAQRCARSCATQRVGTPRRTIPPQHTEVPHARSTSHPLSAPRLSLGRTGPLLPRTCPAPGTGARHTPRARLHPLLAPTPQRIPAAASALHPLPPAGTNRARLRGRSHPSAPRWRQPRHRQPAAPVRRLSSPQNQHQRRWLGSPGPPPGGGV